MSTTIPGGLTVNVRGQFQNAKGELINALGGLLSEITPIEPETLNGVAADAEPEVVEVVAPPATKAKRARKPRPKGKKGPDSSGG